MTARQTPALILTVRDYGEADLVVTFLTPDGGRLTGIAKHAKKSKRRFAHCLEPLSRVTLFLAPRTRGELEFLQRGELVKSFPALRRDLKRLAAAAVLAEVAGLLAGPPETHREIFAALEEALGLLEEGHPPDSLLPAFLLHLLVLGGYRPRWRHCLVCNREPAAAPYFSVPRGGVVCRDCRPAAPGPFLPLSLGTWKLLRLARDLPRDKLSRLRFPAPQRDESLALFKAFLRFHLGQEGKSWAFWDKVVGRNSGAGKLATEAMQNNQS